MTMRAVVCGTRFGQVYLQAFRHPANPVGLAGILANGSPRSVACAKHYGVPLYTDLAQLPDDVDIGCVVIRGGLLGGRGAEVAMALMARGIHVLQEHPLHSDELAQCLRQARRHGVVYHLNSFYVHLAPVRRFIAATRALLREQPARYVDAACGFQLAYSLLDILGQALGGVRPWAFAELPERGPGYRLTDLDVPFRSLDGVLAGVPVTLRVQNQLDPADPDSYAHLMHRVTVGTEAGNLTLVATHGPTVWSARPDFPRSVGGADATPYFGRTPAAGSAGSDGHLDLPSATVLGEAEAPSYRRVFESVWSAGVAGALRELCAAIPDGTDSLRRGQYQLTVCQLWQDITARLGPPELLSATPPRFLVADDLMSVAAAGEEAAGTRGD